ncbi:MAG: Uma2 family endonuclease [Vicinamibacteria bacterium]
MSTLLELEPRPIRVEEYHRMIEAGILGEEDKVELIEGVIVSVSPQSRKHAFVIQRLVALLSRVLDEGRYAILPQLPLTLGDLNEPEPDVAVVPAEDARSPTEHPSRALLVVEVSGDSLAKDRRFKTSIYARFGVSEYWIVNLQDETIEVHRDPDPPKERYRSVLTFVRSQELQSVAVPEIRLVVDRLFA